jgi:hypothetical protein
MHEKAPETPPVCGCQDTHLNVQPHSMHAAEERLFIALTCSSARAAASSSGSPPSASTLARCTTASLVAEGCGARARGAMPDACPCATPSWPPIGLPDPPPSGSSTCMAASFAAASPSGSVYGPVATKCASSTLRHWQCWQMLHSAHWHWHMHAHCALALRKRMM